MPVTHSLSPEFYQFVAAQLQETPDIEGYLRQLVEDDMRGRAEAKAWLLEKLRPALEEDESNYIKVTAKELMAELRKR